MRSFIALTYSSRFDLLQEQQSSYHCTAKATTVVHKGVLVHVSSNISEKQESHTVSFQW